MGRIGVLVLLLSVLAGCGRANLDAGDRAYLAGDYRTALKNLRPLAERGDAAAQYRMGEMCAAGNGVPIDRHQAVEWYRKAAEQGHAKAQLQLGLVHEHGEGGPARDAAQAAAWYRKAAEQGEPSAQFLLGKLYDAGRGVPQDKREAARWYEAAAAQGEVLALSYLGLLYATGNGLPRDLVQAYKWFDLAASTSGSPPAAGASRDEIALQMSQEQIAQARQISAEWAQRHRTQVR
jgi:hypothetical protein